MKSAKFYFLTGVSGLTVWLFCGVPAHGETVAISAATELADFKITESPVGSGSESNLLMQRSPNDIVLSLDASSEALDLESDDLREPKPELSNQPALESGSNLASPPVEPITNIPTALPPAETKAAGLRAPALAQAVPTLEFAPQDQIAQLDAPGGQIQPIDPVVPQPTTPEPTVPEQTPAPLPSEPPVTPPTPPAIPTPALSNSRPSSYVGVGGNFGVLGDTALGNTSLNIYSKIGLTRYLSFRPAAVIDFNNAVTFLLPITVDLRARSTGEFQEVGIRSFAPYIGGGVAVNTNGEFGPLLSGGVDIPISRRFTATAGINVGFLDPIDVGVFVGIGYNFSGF
jgi:hypothetical protein